MTYEEFLKDLLIRDERFVILTAENRAAMRSLPDVIGNRFIDFGISEQSMVGAAAGLALAGRIPIVHAFSTFLTMRAFEFIRTDVGIGKLPVKLVGAASGFLSEANGPTHQAIEDIGIMRIIPGINIFCPADVEDMLICLPKIFESAEPFYIRYNNLPASVKHNPDFNIGKAEVISDGDDICIFTYGILLKQILQASSILTEAGLSIRIINMRTIKPIDEEKIIEVSIHCKLIVTVEDHLIVGGLYSIIAEVLLKSQLTAKVLPLGLNEKWFKPALLNDVIDYEGFSGEQIAAKIKAAI